MGSTENCSVCDAVRSVPGRSPFLVPQKLTRSPDQTPTRSRRSEWAGRKARCCRAGFPCRQAPLRLRLPAHPPPLAGEALGKLPPERLPCKGSCRRQPTEGCRTSPCQYPSRLPQSSPTLRCGAYTKPQHHPSVNLPGGRERPPYNARRTAGTTGNGRHGRWMTVEERPPA